MSTAITLCLQQAPQPAVDTGLTMVGVPQTAVLAVVETCMVIQQVWVIHHLLHHLKDMMVVSAARTVVAVVWVVVVVLVLWVGSQATVVDRQHLVDPAVLEQYPL